ncbi:MAG: hypothetical protein WCT23_08210 [Candidatus Neomarinimicrobiota bacterium]
MKYSEFKKIILAEFDSLQNESGEEFLELMVDTIDVYNQDNQKITVFYGWEYNLSRSRHWDKEEKHYIMHDGFTQEHLTDLYDALVDLQEDISKIVLNVDGMNDLDEPIHKEIIVEY